MSRLALTVRGVVQGVGFRPFVRRAALARGLAGWVQNGRDGVRIEVQGAQSDLDGFLEVLRHEVPAPAHIEVIEHATIAEETVATITDEVFSIVRSRQSAEVTPSLPADLATCDACVREVMDPKERRFRYPFTNCTRCGPRWSIVTALPYDRANTTMRGFDLCSDCAGEYRNIDDRRYHAQPIACPRCGPALAPFDLHEVLSALRAGQIVALRGLGGFQLLVDATNDAAVVRLRERKRRPDQPFAVMFENTDHIARDADVSEAAASALRSAAAPIVLLPRLAGVSSSPLSPQVYQQSPWLGAMLPTTPLHHILLRDMVRPLVCTSANLSSEPMCTEARDVEQFLSGVADMVASHNRPIARPVDDSVVRTSARGVEVLRFARGYAPLPVARVGAPTVLALGAHLKSTVALAHRGQLVLSQHLGDLVTPRARDLLAETVRDLCAFFEAKPAVLACDQHPDYASTRLAEELAAGWNVPLTRVQHHHAHVAAVVAEHGLEGEVLGLAWDGIGLGDDGTLWGGEALVCEGARYRRAAHLATFRLPGGEKAIREPRRSAVGLLTEVGVEPRRVGLHDEGLAAMLERDLHSPRCSSIGRLFDAVAAMIGLVAETSFEGHAPLALEACAVKSDESRPYPLPLVQGVGDLGGLVHAILDDLDAQVPLPHIARRFHLALVELGVAMARHTNVPRVVLAGGCFANHLLADGLHRRLDEEGFEVYAGKKIPPGDNGIAAGQAWIATQSVNAESPPCV